MGSDTLDETDLAGNANNSSFFEYIFLGGKRIARRDYLNNVNYYFADHLGTARIVANSSGTILDDSDFYPFGGERPVMSSSGNSYKFTGKERDPESALDDFDARYYSSSMGRFMTPDWSASSNPDPVPYADLHNPQSLNLYSYTKNDPTTETDPNGHCDIDNEHHNWLWCLGHALGIEHTVKEQAVQEVIAARRAVVDFLLGKAFQAMQPCPQEGMSCGVVFPFDFAVKGETVNSTATFASEGEARAVARTKLGSDAVEVEPGKWRSKDGKWQYRAKPGDLNDPVQGPHIHLEELNPKTGQVIQNIHLRWPEGIGRE
ncbi:MAG: hypothetical protein DMG35_05490 [Acidobacteria bacterium]|nr:MAG: hypothetical protein DMG35_05490 [Acidobacteriota bacterium]